MYKTLAALSVVLVLVFGLKSNTANSQPAPTQVESSVDENFTIPDNLTLNQEQILKAAYQIAKADGHKDPRIVQGIVLQESKAGEDSSYKVNGRFYGLGQVQLPTAREVMQAFPELWKKYSFQTKTDDELKANLILNSAFNLEIISKYLKILQRRYGLSGRDLINAYQKGPNGVKSIDSSNYHYALGVERKLQAIRTSK